MAEQPPNPPPVIILMGALAATPAASDANPPNPPTPAHFAAKTTLPWMVMHKLIDPIPLNGKD
eukprot:2152518-Ditylum_brightwellii.AAC.1